MAVSSGCTTTVAERATTTPEAVTTLIDLYHPRHDEQRHDHAADRQAAKPRAIRGIGMLTMALDGDWYSRMTGSVGSSRSSRVVLIALDEARGESCMT